MFKMEKISKNKQKIKRHNFSKIMIVRISIFNDFQSHLAIVYGNKKATDGYRL